MYDLIIAKLETYGFHVDALKLIHDCLSNKIVYQTRLFIKHECLSNMNVYQIRLFIKHDCLSNTTVHQTRLFIKHDCLSNRKQRVKVYDVYSSWKDIFYGVLRGSILDHFLLNIHKNDVLYFSKNDAL